VWGYSAHRDTLRIAGAPDEVASERARAAVLGQMADWNPSVRWLIKRADASSLTVLLVKSSLPIAHWTTIRVTLLGDALHNMTPYRGVGANTALRYAGTLSPMFTMGVAMC
jgi:2-polyprenyl-6-methoxyphenol hydroxylase-like FAD-dependent oxidoreductase